MIEHGRRGGSIARAGLLVLLLSPGVACALELGPKSLPLKIAGLTVEIPATASLDVETKPDGVQFRAAAKGNLQSIQEKALEIARRLPLPHQNCARRGINIVVDSVDTATITPSGSTALVELSGHLTAWACGKILGISAKTKVASDRVKLSIPVQIVVVDTHQLALRLDGTATVATAHPLTEEVAGVFVGDLNGRLNAALDKILDAGSARAKIPPLPGLDVAIERAEFVQDGKLLGVRASGHGKMTGAAFATLMAFLVK